MELAELALLGHTALGMGESQGPGSQARGGSFPGLLAGRGFLPGAAVN